MTAAVTASGTPVTGKVAFLDGPAILGAATLDASGVATFKTSLLSAGVHQLTAHYQGSAAGFPPSTSAPPAQQTVKALVSAGYGGSLSYAAGSEPRDIVKADFNGDGITDLALSNFFGTGTGPGTV